jgi:biotin synthase-like enzyme
MYRETKFEIRPVDEVKRDIDTAKQFTEGRVETVFIGDSDSLVIKRSDMCDILRHLHAAFPSLIRVTSYARTLTLRRKLAENLSKIRSAGLTRLHIGLETGSARLLKQIQKGASPETMIKGCEKAREAGFEVSLYVLAGIGGESDWEEHARETANVINNINPDFIRIRTLTPQPGTTLFSWWEGGAFEMPSPETILKEQKALIQGLSVTSRYLSDHVSNYAPIDGDLPTDKAKMMTFVDEALERLEEDRAYKAELENMRYLRRL